MQIVILPRIASLNIPKHSFLQSKADIKTLVSKTMRIGKFELLALGARPFYGLINIFFSYVFACFF